MRISVGVLLTIAIGVEGLRYDIGVYRGLIRTGLKSNQPWASISSACRTPLARSTFLYSSGSPVNPDKPPLVVESSNVYEESSSTSLAPSYSAPLAGFDLTRSQALILLLVISAIYGSNYAAIKTMDEAGVDPFYSTIVRFALATAVFVPAVTKALKDKRMDIISGGMEIGILNGLGYLFQAVSLEQPNSSTSNVAFIASLSCVTVPLLDFVIPAIRRETLPVFSIKRFYPALLALVGVACLELHGDGSDGGGGGLNGIASLSSLSNVAAAMQPLFFGLAFWRLERLVKRCTSPDLQASFTGANLFAVLLVASVFFVISTLSTAWAMSSQSAAIAGVLVDPTPAVSILFSRIADQRSLLQEPVVLCALLWTGLVTTAGATLLETYAIKKLTAAEVSVIYTTEPLWGTAIAFALLGESIGWSTFLGGIFITAACVLSGTQAVTLPRKTST